MIEKWSGVCVQGKKVELETGVTGERRLLDLLSLPSKVHIQELRAYTDADSAGQRVEPRESTGHRIPLALGIVGSLSEMKRGSLSGLDLLEGKS